MSHHTDDELLAAVRALPAPRPDELTQRRRRATLDDAIAAEVQQRRRRLTPVAAALLVLGLAGSASAAVALAVAWPRDVDTVAVEHVPAVAPASTPKPHDAAVVVVEPDAAAVLPAASAGQDAGDVVVATPAPVHKRRVDVLDRLLSDVQRDGSRAARTAWMQQAERDFAGTDARLVQAIDDASDNERQARLRRTRCETWLRHRRTVDAIDVCRSYSQHHPNDAGARPLAFGAGGVAEELGALDDAIDLYTRAIILSPLQGQSSADAIKARARVHARAGHHDDAAADLRLFLSLRPAAAFDDDVRALADRLGL
jgi:tetratricopeptide (TPR) repeat protein